MSWSTHVLDASSGVPATGVPVTLNRTVARSGWVEVLRGVTDRDGRLSAAGSDVVAVSGVYRVDFDTGAYFADGGGETFYPLVSITFRITDPAAHHHVPLLLSPFAYTTYRGS